MGAEFIYPQDSSLIDEKGNPMPTKKSKKDIATTGGDSESVVKRQDVLRIDRAALPTIVQFIGEGWTTEVGEQDKRSLALTEVDFSKAVFDCPLRDGEQSITGTEKLAREKAEDERFVRLDPGVAIALFQEANQATLRFLHNTFGVTWMEFTGTPLHSPDSSRRFLHLRRAPDGSWNWSYRFLHDDRNADYVSVRLAR